MRLLALALMFAGAAIIAFGIPAVHDATVEAEWYRQEKADCDDESLTAPIGPATDAYSCPPQPWYKRGPIVAAGIGGALTATSLALAILAIRDRK